MCIPGAPIVTGVVGEDATFLENYSVYFIEHSFVSRRAWDCSVGEKGKKRQRYKGRGISRFPEPVRGFAQIDE
jgi:hypothetical protein